MRDSPRLLLFGRSGAGKSALLGALFEVASQPSPLFKGRLVDTAGKLATLARATPDDTLPHTKEELISYPVQFQAPDAKTAPYTATLVDCNGDRAVEYLSGKQGLERETALTDAMLTTDTLILVVDASASAPQLETDFTQFGRFLQQLRDVRGKRLDVAGLPVYLVLAKCDRLAQAHDTRSTWVQRIEEAKRGIGQKFQAFLARQQDQRLFGSLRGHLWATAAHRPALQGAAASAEPYGVAELFRQCLHSAEVYRLRRDRAGQRLSSIVIGVLAVFASAGLGAGLLWHYQPERERTVLQEQLASLVPGTALPAAERLRGSPALLEDRLKALQKLENDPDYSNLPSQLRTAAEAYTRELAAYLQAYDAYQKTIKLPHLARNAEELTRYEQALTEFQLPAEYREAWADTRLARRIAGARKEYNALHAAENEAINWIHQQIKETRRLRERGNEFGVALDAGKPPSERELDDWFRAVDAQLRPRGSHPGSDPIPGVSGLTYERLEHMPRVRQARSEWSAAQAVLRPLADELRGRADKK
jgi:hypothetical protein